MSNSNNTGKYETTDVRTGLVWIVAGGLVISVALVVLGIHLTFDYLHRRELTAQQSSGIEPVTRAVAESRAVFPEPHLQTAPQADLAAMRTREDAELNSYGWVDRAGGVVRLPVARAMELLVQRGLPVRGDPNAPKATRTPLDMQQARPLQREPAKEGK